MRSIERTLLAWIVGALAVGSLLAALVTYFVTLEEMNEVFDGELQNVAEAVGRYHQARGADAPAHGPALPVRSDAPADTEIVTITWTRAGQRVWASDPRVRVAYSGVEGLARPSVDGEAWIVYTSVQPGGVAQAAQRVSARREMAGESAAQVLPPLALLATIVGALLVYGLRRGLQPLDAAARAIAARDARSLVPIDIGATPREIAPLVAAMNDLIARLDSAFGAQRRFVADAAHELRTPLTALRLQLQLLGRCGEGAARDEAMHELALGVDRAHRLVQQLLEVARSEHAGGPARSAPVELGSLVREVVAAFSAQAEAVGIDLGMAPSEARPLQVPGDRDRLRVLLDNLVDNALRYTPRGGVVDVQARRHDGRVELRVVDDGPGIPPAERDRVFDRFYRGEHAATRAGDRTGSGLGLAIVRAIADSHGAEVSLHTPPSGAGLEVRVAFAPPRAPSHATAATA